MSEQNAFFNGWGIVELADGQQLTGRLSEKTTGIPMLRVDVPAKNGAPAYAVFYSAAVIRSIELTQEETALPANAMKRHVVKIEHYTSASGNPTWKAFDSDDHLVYLRQSHRDLLVAAGLWDTLNQMAIGDTWNAEFVVYTVADGDFLKPVEIEPGGTVIVPVQADEAEGETLDTKGLAQQWAQKLLEGEFVIFDTETTGFALDDQIIQIGIVDQDGNVLLDQLIKPTKPIANTNHHGLTDELVAGAPSFSEVYPQIKAALAGKMVVAYNFEFDNRLLCQEIARCELEPIQFKDFGCAMEEYARYYGQWNPKHCNYKWQSLENALFHFGLKHEDFGTRAHDAGTDAKATLALIRKMAGIEQENLPV